MRQRVADQLLNTILQGQGCLQVTGHVFCITGMKSQLVGCELITSLLTLGIVKPCSPILKDVQLVIIDDFDNRLRSDSFENMKANTLRGRNTM